MNAAEHRDQAAQLLADVNDCPDAPSAQRVLTQSAIAHALLGLLEIQLGKQQNITAAAAEFKQCDDPGCECHTAPDKFVNTYQSRGN